MGLTAFKGFLFRTPEILHCLLALALLSTPVAVAGSRDSKKIGVGIGLFNEPFLSLMGYNLAYNLHNKLRLTAGYGSVSITGSNFTLEVQSIGGNLRYFPFDWNFAPFLEGGASSSSGKVSGSGTVSGLSMPTTGVFYSVGAGLDWQTTLGLNLGLSYKMLFGSNANHFAAPGFHLGWFF